jgi:dTDP-4-amino-4,6-dideoxygalactose transaminase
MKISDFPVLSFALFRSNHKSPCIKELYGKQNITYFYFGRGALWNAVKMMCLTGNQNILMPAYQCGVEAEVVSQAEVKIKFFKVNKNMEADLKDIEEKIDANTRALFIIHYYGFPQRMNEILELCKKHNLVLIEDAAHAMFTKYNGRYLGTFGDFGILSMKKTLPVPNGGALVIKDPRKSISIQIKNPNKRSLFMTLMFMLRKNLWVNYAFVLPIIDLLLFMPLKVFIKILKIISGNNLGITNPSSMDFKPAMGNLGISAISVRIMDSINYSEIINSRRKNYEYLLNKLKASENIDICFRELPSGVSPCFFMISTENRDFLQAQLSKKGISTFIFGKYLHRLLPKQGFEDARYLSRKIICLPIHQDLGSNHLDYMAQVVLDTFSQMKKRVN